MVPLHDSIYLLILIVPILVLAVRFLYWLVDRNLRTLARLESDPDYRHEALKALDAQVAARADDPRLRRRRADIRHLAGDQAGVVEDLSVYLQRAPADDAAWSELAESLLALGQPADALRAAELPPQWATVSICPIPTGTFSHEP